tara:strand:+ start:26 stop:880 length:855 start_codon:yes stop_codon:yes gene_type:complete
MDYNKDNSGHECDVLSTYWRDIKNCRPLSRSRETELVRRAHSGDNDALNELVTANLRFVVSVAKRYQKSGLSLVELISEGNLGLIESVKRFDESRGFKFITYAVWWIRQAILKAIAEKRKIARPPMSHINDLQKVERVTASLVQKLGRIPTEDEIATCAELSRDRTRRALYMSQNDLSLDSSVFEEGDKNSLYSVFVSQDPRNDEVVEWNDLCNALHKSLSVLDEREGLILRSYFGLMESSSMTLQEIGDELGLTRERVRQLRDRALQKVRSQYGEILGELSSN